MTEARLAVAEIATAGDGVDDGEITGLGVDALDDDDDRAAGDTGADRSGAAAGEGAPDAVEMTTPSEKIRAKALSA